MRYLVSANGAEMSLRTLKREKDATQITSVQVGSGTLSKRAARKVRRRAKLSAQRKYVSVVGGQLIKT
jgi:hypothetical protein